jgi:uncharacterized protein (TIGR02145 family)
MPPQTGKVLDTRDGKWYKTVLMPDGKWWMAENLAWAGAGIAGYYQHETASLIAINGSHVPADSEWNAMISAAGGGLHLKSSTGWSGYAGLDTYGFALAPTGYLNPAIASSERSYHMVGPYVTGNFRITKEANPYNYVVGSASSGSNQPFYYTVRLIVDSGNVPDTYLPQLFGADFHGFERGYSLTLNNHVEWIDTHGGTARGIPTAPAIFDEWLVEAEFWCNAEQAQQIEAVVPPYCVPGEAAIRLPYRGGEATFAGLLPASSDGTLDTYAYPEVRKFSSMGRKGVRQDLFGYRISFVLRTKQDGATANPQTSAPTVTVPSWLERKFASHQIQDWAAQVAGTFGAAQGASSDFWPVNHGRRRDINFNLDHLTQAQADSLVQFFRGVRHNAVTVNVDNGPNGIQAVSVRLKGLSLQRGAGLWWDGSLEMCLA